MTDSVPTRSALPLWFIAVLGAPLVIGGWYAAGQPGRALQDGDYGCSAGVLVLAGDGPGATVEGGQVVDLWDVNRNGKKRAVEWSDAERRNPREFSVRSVGVLSGKLREFVCTNND